MNGKKGLTFEEIRHNTSITHTRSTDSLTITSRPTDSATIFGFLRPQVSTKQVVGRVSAQSSFHQDIPRKENKKQIMKTQSNIITILKPSKLLTKSIAVGTLQHKVGFSFLA